MQKYPPWKTLQSIVIDHYELAEQKPFFDLQRLDSTMDSYRIHSSSTQKELTVVLVYMLANREYGQLLVGIVAAKHQYQVVSKLLTFVSEVASSNVIFRAKPYLTK